MVPQPSPADATDAPARTGDSPPDRPAGRDPAGERHKSADDVAAIYADVADAAARWAWTDRLFTGRMRRRQFGDLEGRVLDVACGTGTNFAFLSPEADVVGVDISPEMLGAAREELDRLGRDARLETMDAQALDFPDDSFDAVVSSFSTCTFPDPGEALREMARVCDPGGRIRLLEHGRGHVGPVNRFLDWRADAHYEAKGCRWNQDPVAVVEDAGLPVLETRTALFGLVTAIETRPP